MENGQNLDTIPPEPVCDDKWSPGDDKLIGSRYSALAANLRMSFQSLDPGEYPLGHLVGCGDILLREVFVRGLQVAYRERRPPQLHFFRRLPNIFLTCEWSISLSASACRIPALT